MSEPPDDRRGKPPSKAPAKKDLATRSFRDAGQWEAWLSTHHASAPGLWIRFAKKGSRHRSVDFSDALDVALCWGWIDSQRKGVDDDWFVQKFTPRGARSLWSKRNQERVQALLDAGRMQPPGLAEVDRAKADGRWEAAYDSHRTATVPVDLRTALDANPEAAALFEILNAANRYSILWRVQTAVRPETRAKRIAMFVAMLGRGEKPRG